MTVFANGLEISSKAQGCKVIADFPDTCFTPPQTPATPPGVPVPYPDFGQDSDLTSGSGTVKIGGKEISQENKSKYSKCSGDEAGCAPKKGIITSKNTGSVYAQKWSMDVKVEGKGVVRFSDIATSNHACVPGDAPPMVITGKPGAPDYSSQKCLVGSWEDIKDECNARRDAVDPKKDTKAGSKNPMDYQAWQAHHIVPDRCYRCGRVAGEDTRMPGSPSREEGICICLPRLKHSAARPDLGGNATVHHHLDDALTALGYPGSKTSPAGCASMEAVRDESLAALGNLIDDDTITAECFDEAALAVHEQTDKMAGRQVRAEKSLSDLSTTARGLLAKAPK
ncbi:MAG: DUF4150 domain-containing protein [Mesorhizobium sp.]|uniref:DUF4150 domain-containing protein n=1 Tax=Mesorhizobium sp. TaxID=1871066 RepID=UPI000FE9C2E8|nr:DUF4150 domain-containing protein [Mesorhizobium sp.]RWP00947.1 MAG: DUF4150 domain-containing protein [Mesorhizobium sp.]